MESPTSTDCSGRKNRAKKCKDSADCSLRREESETAVNASIQSNVGNLRGKTWERKAFVHSNESSYEDWQVVTSAAAPSPITKQDEYLERLAKQKQNKSS